MFGLGKAKPVAEHEAKGEIERVYHELRQVLRVSGVNLNFRTWAGYEKFLPAMWDAIRPNLETRVFEAAADQVRAEAAQAAVALGPLGATTDLPLGPSQRYQIQAALDLYHYVNPKLLVLTSAISLVLSGEVLGVRGHSVELIERGVPERMYPMEMEAEEPDDPQLRDLLKDIQETLALPSVNSDYRTLALWPAYLERAWSRLRPLVGREDYCQAADALRESSRGLARTLPYPVPLSGKQVEELGQNADAVLETTSRFEQILPPLILNIALAQADWKPTEALLRSPFPAAPWGSGLTGAGGAE